jgi:hypothetical protein
MKGVLVFVYYNLHKHCWSVKDLKTGRVIRHADRLELESVRFRVSESGRQRVLREKRKNVHAGVVGYLLKSPKRKPSSLKTQVSYNPYRGSDFYRKSNGSKIKVAARVYMSRGQVFV